MRPGQYLALRRFAAGLDEVTAQYDFDNVCARLDVAGRTRAIAAIEADDGDLTLLEVQILSTIFDLDVDMLFTVMRDGVLADGIVCRACGCSWDDPCDPPCAWAEGGCTSDSTALCTACADLGRG